MSTKKTYLRWARNSIVVVATSVSLNAFAHYAPVWSDSSGATINDGSGDCLRTITWNSTGCGEAPSDEHAHGTMTHTHDGGTNAHEHAKPAPVVAPVVVFEREPFNLESGAAFKTSGSELSAEGQAEVKAFADKLEGHDVKKITVEGYTDDRGPESFNQDLSEKRAEAVKAEMVKNGLDGNIITAIGHGESSPVADNETSAGRAKNRRVTVSVEGLK